MKKSLKQEIVQRFRNQYSSGKIRGERNQIYSGKSLMFSVLLVFLLAIFGCESGPNILRGTISGRVIDTSGNNIPGATVASHRSLYSSETDKSGNYSLSSLDSGNHQLTVEREGYLPASKSIALDTGEEKVGVDFKLTPVSGKITWSVFKRAYDSVTIDVTTDQQMICTVVYQGYAQPQIRTPPSTLAQEARFVVSPLRSSMDYNCFVEGKTADGRIYTSASGTFRPLPLGYIPGPPPVPEALKASPTHDGSKISWTYTGNNPLKGFRVFRALNSQDLAIWQDENFVYQDQRLLIDDQVQPGALTRYAIQSVDLDGVVSSISAEIAFIPPGTLSGNAVWYKKFSPLEITGDIIVPDKTTLTIESGVVVRVATEDGFQGGLDPKSCEFIVDGNIIIGSSTGDPVRFLSSSSLPGRKNWSGIRITALKSEQISEINSMEIANAEYGMLAGDSPLSIGKFTAKYCQTGFLLQSASATVLSNLFFEECGTGFSAEGNVNCTISNINSKGGDTGVSFSGNRSISLSSFDIRSSSAIGVEISDSASPTLRNGVITSRKLGLDIKAAAGDFQYLTIDAPSGVLIDGANKPVLQNNIIVNQISAGTGNGIEERTSGRSYPYNNIFGFQNPVSGCNQNGSPVLNINPLFLGGSSDNFNYQLSPTSQLKNVSSNNGEIGAYGKE
ncbi:MAG: carboxypeptidase regulatory-like domain-containing protein [Candidatus Riflebacteria bacterium]|nr:carboxypeptidase regulatory-like domain-containing protein [Candidatus Riflebacteria bacterium]